VNGRLYVLLAASCDRPVSTYLFIVCDSNSKDLVANSLGRLILRIFRAHVKVFFFPQAINGEAAPLILNLSIRRCVINVMSRPLFPRGISRYSLRKRLDGLQSQSGSFREEITFVLAGNRNKIPCLSVISPNHYTDCAVHDSVHTSEHSSNNCTVFLCLFKIWCNERMVGLQGHLKYC
jgi:hypothetical protein